MRKKPLAEQDTHRLSELGQIIRDSRRGRLSLEQLARLAGISAGQLSHIENGTGNPTVEMLVRIADALGLRLSDLLEQPATAKTYVVKSGQRRRFHSPLTDHEVTLITPGIRHDMSVVYSVSEPGPAGSRRPPRRGDVLYYVLSGELDVKKDGVVYHLGPHDALLLSLPAFAASSGDAQAGYLVVFRPEAD
jgi:transcriptional regulator with XRE-family HTH domain